MAVDATSLNSMISQIKTVTTQVEGKLNAAKADFADDGLFNSADLPETDLSLSSINNMEYEDVVALLAEGNTSASINAELTKQQQTFALSF